MPEQYKYLLAHPSYGRPEQAADYAHRWLSKAGNRNIVYSLSVESDELEAYKKAFQPIINAGAKVHIWPGEYGTCVAASNAAVKNYMDAFPNQPFDLLVLVSDDMDCPLDWTDNIEKGLCSYNGGSLPDTENFPFTVQVHDGVVKHILTLPIMSFAAWKMLGYVYHPSYASMYADNDLRMTSDMHMRTIDLSYIIFSHNHWVHGKGIKDATYEHQDNNERHKSGAIIYGERKSTRFPLDISPWEKPQVIAVFDDSEIKTEHHDIYTVPEPDYNENTFIASANEGYDLEKQQPFMRMVNDEKELNPEKQKIFWPVTVYRNNISGEYMVQPYLIPVSGKGASEKSAMKDMYDRLAMHLAMVDESFLVPGMHKSAIPDISNYSLPYKVFVELDTE